MAEQVEFELSVLPGESGANPNRQLGNREKHGLLRLRGREPAVSDSDAREPDRQNPAESRELLEVFPILEEATAKAAKKALAWQFAQAMKEQNVTKAALARRMKTSRAQLDRLLDPENQPVTLKTLARAADILGMRVQIELLDS